MKNFTNQELKEIQLFIDDINHHLSKSTDPRKNIELIRINEDVIQFDSDWNFNNGVVSTTAQPTESKYIMTRYTFTIWYDLYEYLNKKWETIKTKL